MPFYPNLVRPAGQVLTPKRDQLQARLNVPSLPPISLLPEALAATITNEEYIREFCPPIVVDGVTRYSPWCPLHLMNVGTTGGGTTGGTTGGVAPLVPGYGSGRPAPSAHYPTWVGMPYVLGTEKNFLLSLPADDYYRMIDKFPLGPVAFHAAIRIEATRHGAPDPLAGVPDTAIAAQVQTAAPIQQSPQAAPQRSWMPIFAMGALLVGAWWVWKQPKHPK